MSDCRTSAAPAGIIERSSYRSDGHDIDVWVMRPRQSGRFPVVIYNHGSRMRADGSVDSACATLGFDTPAWSGVAAGHCAVVFPEGRGYGASTGPKLEDCKTLEDVRAFLRGRADDVIAGATWLGGQPWADPSRLLLCGCSHGGIVSLLAQAEMTVRGTVLQAPAVGDQAKDVADTALTGALDRATAPIRLQHAELDLHAPIEFSRSLLRRGQDRGKDIRMCTYPYRQTVSGHDQFSWVNREIWGADLDRFVCEAFDMDGHLVCDPAAPAQSP